MGFLRNFEINNIKKTQKIKIISSHMVISYKFFKYIGSDIYLDRNKKLKANLEHMKNYKFEIIKIGQIRFS